jgi:hypothetical protein
MNNEQLKMKNSRSTPSIPLLCSKKVCFFDGLEIEVRFRRSKVGLLAAKTASQNFETPFLF